MRTASANGSKRWSTPGTLAARTVAAIDENLVIAGLSRYMRVFDPATFAPSASSDDESMDVDVTPFDGPRA